MEDGRMGRCLALIQKEAEMEKDFQEVKLNSMHHAVSYNKKEIKLVFKDVMLINNFLAA